MYVFINDSASNMALASGEMIEALSDTQCFEQCISLRAEHSKTLSDLETSV